MGTLYTQATLDAVEASIVKLVTGAQKVSVTWTDSAGTRTTSYQSTDLDKLRALRNEIAANINPANGGSRSILTNSRKGL